MPRGVFKKNPLGPPAKRRALALRKAKREAAHANAARRAGVDPAKYNAYTLKQARKVGKSAFAMEKRRQSGPVKDWARDSEGNRIMDTKDLRNWAYGKRGSGRMRGSRKKSGQDSAVLGQHGKSGGHAGYGQ